MGMTGRRAERRRDRSLGALKTGRGGEEMRQTVPGTSKQQQEEMPGHRR